MPNDDPSAEIIERLKALYRRNGYLRRLDPVRRVVEGQLYKKGAELRLVADSAVELRAIRRLLRQAGFCRAKPFRKANQWRQPLYGVKEVARFLKLIGEPKSRRKRKPA